MVAGLLILLFPVTGLGGGPGDKTSPVVGPGGQPVNDSYTFVQRPLTGDGQITVAVSKLTSEQDGPWAKGGLMFRAGSRYVAIMVTGGHGVRMQHDYLYDKAGPTAHWLRLSRTGDTVTGEASADGVRWTVVDRVQLSGSVQAGVFVACPSRIRGIRIADDTATAVFSRPELVGSWPVAEWSADPSRVTGHGDLGPATRSDLPGGAAAGDPLFGTFPALIVVVVVGTLMVTTEYRYGVIRLSMSAGTGRVRMLLAKALVLGGATFAAALVATVVAVPLWLRVVRGLGAYVFPAGPWVLLRAEVGTAAVLAITAVLALGVGVILRRSAAAVTTVVVVTVLPYLLALTPFLPASLAQWMTRVTPAAAFAVQQTLTHYPQVDSVYTPANGYYPLAPWAGLAVLCGYSAVALAVAAVLLHRRDV
jgi:ABC-type transport system involved in multi-copper enzyme maturation permease subunit